MKIYCQIFICDECRKVLTFLPHQDGVFYNQSVICADDGHQMMRIVIDEISIANILAGKPLS